MGFTRTVNLDDVAFIVQKRGVPLRDVVTHLMKQNERTQVKERIRQIFALYRREYAKGLMDHDHGVLRNVGFIGEKPIHLDVGKLMEKEEIEKEEMQREDLLLVAHNIELFFKERYPDMVEEMRQEIEESL